MSIKKIKKMPLLDILCFIFLILFLDYPKRLIAIDVTNNTKDKKPIIPQIIMELIPSGNELTIALTSPSFIPLKIRFVLRT